MYVVRRAVRVSQRLSEIGAEQNLWNGRNGGLKVWVVTGRNVNWDTSRELDWACVREMSVRERELVA